jgi:hypothetical protein
MGRLIVHNAVTVNGAFEAPAREPDGWLVLDADSSDASLEQFVLADAMVLGRRTYEGLAAVWPHLGDDPTQDLVDEFWFWLSPYLWASGPRIFDGVGPVRLQLAASTAYPSGVLWLRYGQPPTSGDVTHVPTRREPGS